MTDQMNQEDLLNYLRSQQANQGTEDNLEQALINLLLNPTELTTKRIRLVEDPDADVIAEMREGIFVNPAGFLEKVQEEIIYVKMLGDGTSLNNYGIICCPACGNIVREHNSTYCPCGRTVCSTPGCAKAGRHGYYCSKIHAFFHALGFSLR